MNINIPDLYTLYVQTDNTDYLSNVVVSSDMYVKNSGSLCGGSTQPSINMVNVAQKIYKTIPDLAPQQQNIQQNLNTPMTFQLSASPVTNGSDLVTFSVQVDYTNFTAGNSYLISTNLIPQFAYSTVFAPDGYVKYSIQIENNTVNEVLLNSTSGLLWTTSTNVYAFNFGINIATATPKIVFTVIIPRPTTVTSFGALI
jgi:hypothetical protein